MQPRCLMSKTRTRAGPEQQYYLVAGLCDEVRAVLDVERQVCVGLVQNTDSFVDEQVWKDIVHTKGHVQDVGHLRSTGRISLNVNTHSTKPKK